MNIFEEVKEAWGWVGTNPTYNVTDNQFKTGRRDLTL